MEKQQQRFPKSRLHLTAIQRCEFITADTKGSFTLLLNCLHLKARASIKHR